MPNERDYLLVGVTGGIGSGKSVVCSFFERLGRTVISADLLAREIMDRDPAVKKGVKGVLGEAAYASDGLLDRRFVAEQAFGNPGLRKQLNEAVHPAVFREIEHRIGMLPRVQRCPYVIIEAALIYESRLDKRLDYVIVVQAEEEKRIRRVIERDHCSREEVLRRMAAQLSADLTARRADFLIHNNGQPDALLPQIQFLDRLLTIMRTPGDAPRKATI